MANLIALERAKREKLIRCTSIVDELSKLSFVNPKLMDEIVKSLKETLEKIAREQISQQIRLADSMTKMILSEQLAKITEAKTELSKTPIDVEKVRKAILAAISSSNIILKESTENVGVAA